jgi:ectoine hydroxylase-related dioxygenase (phytanoyl-CoA dioxygenase family)
MTTASRATARETLPRATTDLRQAKSDLDLFGYCLLSNLLSEPQLRSLQEKVPRQAKAEEERGLHDQAQGSAASQYVYMLINKGDVFLELVQHPVILEMIEHVLGPEFLLSASDAIIAKPGGGLMPLHTDQWWMPPPAAEGAPQIRVGAIKRFNKGSTRTEPGKSISAAACANVMWMVSDFTEENGGTRLVPRSHLCGEQPDPSVPHKVESIAGAGPAGTALVFDGRLWHATGSNTTRQARLGVITAYCGPQFRPMENYTLGAREEIVKSASPRLLGLLGFKIWDGYGKLDDPNETFIARGRKPVGAL